MVLILKIIKKEMIINKKNILLIMCMFSHIIYSQETPDLKRDPIRDLPEEISFKYGTDIIPDKETALEYADIILKKRYINTKIDELKPYEITLIEEDKVWEIKLPTDTRLRGIAYFHIKINKNTGEVLNIWVDK